MRVPSPAEIHALGRVAQRYNLSFNAGDYQRLCERLAAGHGVITSIQEGGRQRLLVEIGHHNERKLVRVIFNPVDQLIVTFLPLEKFDSDIYPTAMNGKRRVVRQMKTAYGIELDLSEVDAINEIAEKGVLVYRTTGEREARVFHYRGQLIYALCNRAWVRTVRGVTLLIPLRIESPLGMTQTALKAWEERPAGPVDQAS